MKRQFRIGAIGALMDEYENAGNELKNLVKGISESDFEKEIDPNTKDEDCRSVQTIVSHVINSGYGYANYIRDWYSIQINSPTRRLFSGDEFIKEMDKMLDYTSGTLEGKWNISEEEIMNIKIKSRWGPEYDIEQLLEHAIVHILRHRRQIEKIISTGNIGIK
jgi:hypothetical protein